MRIAKYEAEIKATYEIPEDPDGAKITIRLLKPGELADIADRATSYEMSSKLGDRPETRVRTSFYLEGLLKFKRCLVGWENIYADEKGKKPLQCNDSNKERLAKSVDGFMRFVMDKYEELDEENRKRLESEEKNSESSPGGSSA